MVARRRLSRLLRKGEEGLCLSALSGLALALAGPRLLLARPLPLVEDWERREVTDVEGPWRGRARELLLALVLEIEMECRWEGG